MNAEEDPERRIRELEQPLSDAARASELGGPQPADGYSYQAPPWAGAPVPPAGNFGPPGSYGAPYPGTTPRPPSGNRVWWILGALLVVGVLALVGGIAAFTAHQFSRGGSAVISTPTSSSRMTTAPRTAPRTTTPRTAPSLTITLAPPPPASSTAPPGGNLTVAGINENQTIACNDNTVDVSGVSNTVVITGHCASLTVSGVQNVITVDAVDTIDASGFNNKVTYHTGSPKVSKSGSGNVVQQG
ncbi:DUF3060 domain-containing protein [Mycobacterium conspicuum]|jgi:hypothetical protein|uniref:Membrane protein n=1 Tax=Mycobacterium conspicuum TaxID=44010 RepID=A0A1X1T6M4_9MYCO|nr:DUF3060 domain-containing protein [Mycobacterium conspicuum]ORV40180.1 hypothetical protein AWC00_16030 [Mycobacterium conspicuum]BBZ37053.1 membrane protein [Mycobacterium conspicuum]